MFNLQAFSTQKSPVSDGPTAVALARIRGLLTKLLHNPETGVLYLLNGDASPITKGMLCRFDADNRVTPTTYLFGDTAVVCLADSLAAGEWGFFRFAGEAEVRLINGIAPSSSDVVYVSGVDGLGDISAPGGAGTWIKQVGWILDPTDYVTVTNPLVKTVLEPCCGIYNPII